MMLLDPAPHIHFVGIGGIGMSGLAQALLEAGYQVSGCDRQRSDMTDRLAALGAMICEGHSARHLVGVDLLVISSAIPPDNADRLEAQRRNIPVVKRAKLLGHLVANQRTIAVAGTHGKTTTTGMIAWILTCAGRDPTVFAGGVLENLGSNARRGNGIHAVVEADEYDRAFLELRPAYAVVTNVEADHPDVFADLSAIVETFGRFLDRVQPGGHIVAHAPAPGARDSRLAGVTNVGADMRQLLAGRPNVTTYGLDAEAPQADWLAHDVGSDAGGQTFTVSRAAEHGQRTRVGEFRLPLPGRHNVANALAATVVASLVGIDQATVAEALASFGGARRRFEVKGTASVPGSGPTPEAATANATANATVTVIDDYAHHPTEIRATLEAVRQRYGGRRVWVVFQPHTYSRTRALLDEFAASLTPRSAVGARAPGLAEPAPSADHVIITDIYPAREEDKLGVSAEDLVDRIRLGTRPSDEPVPVPAASVAGAADVPGVAYIASLAAAADYVAERLLPGDVVLTLGAGDVWQVGDAILKRLGRTQDSEANQ